MTNVLVRVEKEEAVSHLELTDVTTVQADKVIDGFFSLFGTVAPPPPAPQDDEKVARQIVKKIIESASPVAKHAHNPIIVAGEPETMEEALNPQIPANAPAHAHTGVKKGIDGRPDRYQCRYRCTKCGQKGKHYIPEGVETVDCHTCQTSLQVKKATPGTQGIQPDRFNNWFVAGSQLPVQSFDYGKAHAVKGV